MAAKRDRVRPTWAERFGAAQKFYSEERAKGICKVCGQGGYVRIAPHPSGRAGQPVRIVGLDIEALRKWIEEAGWVHVRCGMLATTTTGAIVLTRRGELAAIRKQLAPLRKAKQSPELCLMTQERVCNQMGVEKGTEYLQGEPTATGRWLHPHEFQTLLDREQELLK